MDFAEASFRCHYLNPSFSALPRFQSDYKASCSVALENAQHVNHLLLSSVGLTTLIKLRFRILLLSWTRRKSGG